MGEHDLGPCLLGVRALCGIPPGPSKSSASDSACCTGGDAANLRARSTCAGLRSLSKCTYEEDPRPTRLHIGRWARAELTMLVPPGSDQAAVCVVRGSVVPAKAREGGRKKAGQAHLRRVS